MSVEDSLLQSFLPSEADFYYSFESKASFRSGVWGCGSNVDLTKQLNRLTMNELEFGKAEPIYKEL